MDKSEVGVVSFAEILAEVVTKTVIVTVASGDEIGVGKNNSAEGASSL